MIAKSDGLEDNATTLVAGPVKTISVIETTDRAPLGV